MKHEWRKHEKELYGVKQTPMVIEVPVQQFIMIDGFGNPNHQAFSDQVSVLFSLAYAIKMGYKNDYTVYPLEGIWRQTQDNEKLDKNLLEYTLMIRQPDFITQDMFFESLERVKRKKPNPLYENIRFEKVHDGKCIQILHIGSFDDEPVSFQKMDLYIKENGAKRIGDLHREIYLSHPQHVEKERFKTILRYFVK